MMDFNVNKYYEAKIFEPGQIAEAVKHCLEDHSLDATEISYTVYSDLSGSGSKARFIDFDELAGICKFDEHTSSIYFSYADHLPHPNVIGLDTCQGFLKLIISVDNVEMGKEIMEVFEQDLCLQMADENLLKDRNLEERA